jgi:hypothetical protein
MRWAQTCYAHTSHASLGLDTRFRIPAMHALGAYQLCYALGEDLPCAGRIARRGRAGEADPTPLPGECGTGPPFQGNADDSGVPGECG